MEPPPVSFICAAARWVQRNAPFQVGVDHPVPLGFLQIEESLPGLYAGVVDHDVKLVKVLADVSEHSVDVCCASDIRLMIFAIRPIVGSRQRLFPRLRDPSCNSRRYRIRLSRSSSAIPLPIPLLAPVTSAVRPSRAMTWEQLYNPFLPESAVRPIQSERTVSAATEWRQTQEVSSIGCKGVGWRAGLRTDRAVDRQRRGGAVRRECLGERLFFRRRNGHLWVHPSKEPARGIDLKELVDKLVLRGISPANPASLRRDPEASARRNAWRVSKRHPGAWL